jgi:hypothetical protein
MGKIHERAQRDLAFIVSDNDKFGDTIQLISPLGDVQTVSATVYYSQSEETADGFRIIKNNPLVIIELAELSAIPSHGERWIVRIPISKQSSTLSSFCITSEPIIDNTFGIITIKLNKVEQS